MEMHVRYMDVKRNFGESQMERRNMLMETGRKMILVIKWQSTELNCFLVFYGRQNFHLVNLAEVSKQSIEELAWFFLTTYSKMQKEM